MPAASRSKAYLVESIPRGLEDLKRRGVPSTARVLRRLIDGAKRTIDITAMYWNLKPTSAETKQWKAALKGFGVREGELLFGALVEAAGRGVKIRIIESHDLDGSGPSESAELKEACPRQFDIRTAAMGAWFGAGIMHQKIWVFDRQAIYLGSANNDWKSMTQVKELGVVVEHNRAVATAMTIYFDTWWKFCGLKTRVQRAFDPVARIKRTVPDWSALLPRDKRKPNPLRGHPARHDWAKPLQLTANGKRGRLVISGSPPELCVGGRVADLDALVNTILEAEETVCVNVMDFAPVSIYAGKRKPPTPVWWPALFDALLHVITTRGVRGRMLVSEWDHTSKFIRPYLQALRAAAEAGSADPVMVAGTLEIRRFRVPGWRQTTSRRDGNGRLVPAKYPDFTRVNHTKYIVTDKRANIGTSNMTWDYFAGTAGASFNTDHPDLVKGLQALFDRDWLSPYTGKVV